MRHLWKFNDCQKHRLSQMPRSPGWSVASWMPRNHPLMVERWTPIGAQNTTDVKILSKVSFLSLLDTYRGTSDCSGGGVSKAVFQEIFCICMRCGFYMTRRVALAGDHTCSSEACSGWDFNIFLWNPAPGRMSLYREYCASPGDSRVMYRQYI